MDPSASHPPSSAPEEAPPSSLSDTVDQMLQRQSELKDREKDLLQETERVIKSYCLFELSLYG